MGGCLQTLETSLILILMPRRSRLKPQAIHNHRQTDETHAFSNQTAGIAVADGVEVDDIWEAMEAEIVLQSMHPRTNAGSCSAIPVTTSLLHVQTRVTTYDTLGETLAFGYSDAWYSLKLVLKCLCLAFD